MFREQIISILEKHKKKFEIKDIKNFKISTLGRGENNLNILVEVGGKEFNFRINQRKSIENNVKREFTSLQKLPIGIGPKPIHYDNSKKIIPHVFSVLSYVQGKNVTRWTKKHLSLHAKALRKLHTKKFPYCLQNEKRRKRFSIDVYLKELFEDFPDILKKDKDIQILFPLFTNFVKKKKVLFSSVQKFSLLHGDTYVDNILFSKNKVSYIDWEWMDIGDPAQDVARHYIQGSSYAPWFINLSGKRLDYYLDEYSASKKFRKRVDAWYIVLRFGDLLYFTKAARNAKDNKFSRIHYKKISDKLRIHLLKKLI